ncbi:hypothetical protein ACIQBJ_05335 [Kitasatospora sp. NPDC088391]|uniref:hypothetical protein n=1 Tax=Kitasatospora sp. NPDC088391 TaxID=3364074 RepID=UPI00382C08C0
MAKKDEEDEHGGGKVKVTESYLKNFADTKLPELIAALDKSPERTKIKLFVGDKSTVSHLLAGSSVDGNTAPGDLVGALSTYAGQLDTYIGTLATQVLRLQGDLRHADWALSDGHDGALSAAQLMWLIDDVLKGGGTGGGTGHP